MKHHPSFIDVSWVRSPAAPFASAGATGSKKGSIVMDIPHGRRIVTYRRGVRELWRELIDIRWVPDPHGPDAFEPGALVSSSSRAENRRMVDIEFGIVVAASPSTVTVCWSGHVVNSHPPTV